MIAILPGCRKPQLLSDSPCAQGIGLRPLFSYNGHAIVKPSEWRTLIQASPVMTRKASPVEITDHVRSLAYARAIDICDCEATRAQLAEGTERSDYCTIERISPEAVTYVR